LLASSAALHAAAEIIERDVQANGRKVAIDILAKAVAQSGKSLRCHAQRQVLLFNVACRNLFGLACYGQPLYGRSLRRRIGHGSSRLPSSIEVITVAEQVIRDLKKRGGGSEAKGLEIRCGILRRLAEKDFARCEHDFCGA
jgi:hypothetical protein